ncbi:uncharacterized protein [Oryza sativa Japonica Group]|uniref:uncharacterized protein n=1 Tax=Oryza sativa subsp. japonica TaxID=39947 RepID=UPI00339C6080
MAHLTPNAIMTLAIFAHLCEMFIGVRPSLRLFRWFFTVQPVSPPTPLPELPRGRTTSPRLLLLSLRCRPASSRLSLLARAPSGRAVASSSVAAASSPTACPPFRAVTTGGAFLPSPFSFLRAGRLQPPLPPRPRAVRPCRRLPRLCNTVPFTGLTVSSPETRRNGAPAGNQWHWCHCTPSSRLLSLIGAAAVVVTILPRHHRAILFPGQATASPVFRRNAVARAASPSVSSAPTPAAPFAVPVRRRTSPSPPPASQRQGRPRPRLSFDRTPPVFVVVVIVPPRRLVVSRRRLHRGHRCGVSHAVLTSVQLLPAALVASSPAPVVVVVVLSSFQVVVAFVPPSSRPRPSSVFRQGRCSPRRRLRPRLRVVKPRASRVSPSSKDRRRSRSLAIRLRRARSSLSFPRLVAWWLVALLVCFA